MAPFKWNGEACRNVPFNHCIWSKSDSAIFPKWNIVGFECISATILHYFFDQKCLYCTQLLQARIVYCLMVHSFVQLTLVHLLPFCLHSCLDYWPNGLFVSHKWPSLFTKSYFHARWAPVGLIHPHQPCYRLYHQAWSVSTLCFCQWSLWNDRLLCLTAHTRQSVLSLSHTHTHKNTYTHSPRQSAIY